MENSLDLLALQPTDNLIVADEMSEGHITRRLANGEARSMGFSGYVGSVMYYIDPEVITREQARDRGEDSDFYPGSQYWVVEKTGRVRPLNPEDRILLTKPPLPQPIPQAE